MGTARYSIDISTTTTAGAAAAAACTCINILNVSQKCNKVESKSADGYAIELGCSCSTS